MRSMVSWITLGLLVAVLVGGPLAMGFVIEREYAALVANAAGANEALRIDGRFDRGWFASTVETTIEIDDADPPTVIALRHDVVHGPIPVGELWRGRSPFALVVAVIDTAYAADPVRLPHIAASLGDEPLVRLIAWLHLDRSVGLTLDVPPVAVRPGGLRTDRLRAAARVELADDAVGAGWLEVRPIAVRDDGGAVTLDASRLRFETRPEGEGVRVTGDLALGAIEVRNEARTVRIAPSEGRYESTYVDGVVGQGEASLAVGDVSIGEAPEEGPTLTGLRAEEAWGLDPDSGLRAFETTLAFTALDGGARRWGPGRVTLAARNVDPVAAGGFRDAMASIEAADPGEVEALRQRVFAEWMPRLLGTSPELVLESLALTSEVGELRGRGRLRVDGSEPAFLTDPLTVWMQTRGELELVVPGAMLDALLDAYLIESVRDEMTGVSESDVAEMAAFMRQGVLGRLVAQGLLVVEGDAYRIDARIADGLPTVNGRLVDPGQLRGGLAPGP